MSRKKFNQKTDTNGIYSIPKPIGYIPRDKNLDFQLRSMFRMKDIDSISRFLFSVSSGASSEYDGKYRMPASELKILFGNGYLIILNKLEFIGLIEWTKTEHKYNSLSNPKYMNSFSIVKGVMFTRHRITSHIGKNRVNSLSTIREEDKALKKAYKHLKQTSIDLPEFNEKNLCLCQGILKPIKDVFGHRIHSILTTIKANNRGKLQNIRQYVKYTREPTAKLVEVDIKASHPFLFVQLILDPKTIIKILGNEYEHLLSLFGLIPDCEKKAWRRMYFGDGKTDPDFYRELEILFRGTNWINHVTQKLENEEAERRNKALAENREYVSTENLIPETNRDFAKQAFMFAVNGGDAYLIKLIGNDYPWTAMILRFTLIATIKVLDKELTEDLSYKEKYYPYKNLAVVLQRTEAFLIQKAYLKSNAWGHLIHDSILCLLTSAGTVKRNIENTYFEHLNSKPIIKEKAIKKD